MAVDPDQVDALAAMVADIYREAETALVRTIARHLRQGLDSPRAEARLADIRALRRSAQAIIAALEADTGTATREALAAAYRHGWTNALADVPRRIVPASGIGDEAAQAAENVVGTGFVEALAGALLEDFGRVEANILRNVVDVFKDVQAGAAARIVTGTQTRREASQSIWSALIRRGITGFTDRAGRRWRLSSYAEMAARTNVQRAAIQGQVDRLTSAGIELVYVSDAPQECVLCRPWEGKILRTTSGPLEVRTRHATRPITVTVTAAATLDQARAAGFQHPNCRHSVSAYLPGVTRVPTDTADPDGDTARQRQRALERRIRAAKEQQEGALTPHAKRVAGARVRAAQAALRDHLAAHPNLKRLRYREQIGAGNIPPRGRDDNAGPLGPPTEPTLDGGPAPAPPSRAGRRAPEPPPADETRRPGPDQPVLEPPPVLGPNPRDLSDEDLEQRMMAALADDPDEFARLAAEMDRREAETRAAEERRAANREAAARRREQRDAELADRFNQLMDEGWLEEEAVAEVYGISIEQQHRDRAIADLRAQGYTGDRFEDLARQAYRDHVHEQYLAAEEATNGYMVNNEGRTRSIDPRDLFTGNEARARRWASDELKGWWDAHGRVTFDEFKAMLTDDPTALRRLRDRGGGDFLA
ncbi:phage minor capsid protein [Actinomadura macra]|uniref:phage minor capsid protein n=1 Tax=Actinomadura macra TaxID=46164 RepID=UPI00083191D4|nr:phage minor capsid protein [Actinomadura macra]